MSVLDEIQPEWDALRDAVKELAEIADMQIAEAKRLRHENAELIDEIDHLLIKRQHTEDVNTKLRELVDELYPLADYGAMDASELDRAHDLMRELGIEVD